MQHRTSHECKTKSEIGKELNSIAEKYVSERMENVDIPLNGGKVLVFDGMAILCSLKRGNWIKTCENLAQVFLLKTDNYLKENTYTVICIIFDPHISGQLPKIRTTEGIGGNNLVSNQQHED